MRKVDHSQLAAAPRGPLTSVAAVRALRPAMPPKVCPFTSAGASRIWMPVWTVLFVQDASAGIFVYYSQLTHPLPACAAGDEVDIVGQTGPGDFAPVIVAHTLTVRGKGALPAAFAAPLEQLVSGRLDSQLVEIAGVVRTVVPRVRTDMCSSTSPSASLESRWSCPSRQASRYRPPSQSTAWCA